MVVLADTRHPARGKVSGGGPPPHFNKIRDNLDKSLPPSLSKIALHQTAVAGGIGTLYDECVGYLEANLDGVAASDVRLVGTRLNCGTHKWLVALCPLVRRPPAPGRARELLVELSVEQLAASSYQTPESVRSTLVADHSADLSFDGTASFVFISTLAELATLLGQFDGHP